jgi:hypothetical protein
MDPYLEMPPFWGDFAPGLLKSISNQLLPQLLPKYDLRVEQYLFVEHNGERLHRVAPDVTISTSGYSPGKTGSAAAVADATMVELDYPEFEPIRQRHLVLIHRVTGQVVAVMELLSPSNKVSGAGGLEAYVRKREEFLASGCHVVELDLLRGGQRLPMSQPLPPGDYYAFIGRAPRRPHCQVIAWPLRAGLPSIPLPLLPEDPEVSLDLGAAFRAAYEPSLYDRRLPYDQPLVPPVRPADETWLRERLAGRGGSGNASL